MQIYDCREAPDELREISSWGFQLISTQSLVTQGFSLVNIPRDTENRGTGIDLVVTVLEKCLTGSLYVSDGLNEAEVMVIYHGDDQSRYYEANIEVGSWLLLKKLRRTNSLLQVNERDISDVPEWSFDAKLCKARAP